MLGAHRAALDDAVVCDHAPARNQFKVADDHRPVLPDRRHVHQERGEATRPVRLNTHEGQRTVSHEGYVITVVDLRPWPTTAGPAAEGDYVVRLHVVRG